MLNYKDNYLMFTHVIFITIIVLNYKLKIIKLEFITLFSY